MDASLQCSHSNEDVLRRLSEDIDFARLMPGQSITLDELARRLHATGDQTLAAVRHLADLGLIAVHNASCTVALIARPLILPRIDRRLVLEQQLAEAAALNSANLKVEDVRAAAAMLKRCALVGDIEGYMIADQQLEQAISAATQMPEMSAEVADLKREFRRAWCAYNRLRDLNEPASIRRSLAEAILKGDVPAAKQAVQHFIDYLRRSY